MLEFCRLILHFLHHAQFLAIESQKTTGEDCPPLSQAIK